MDELREQWNERWRDKSGRPLSPDPWLLKVLHLLPSGEVLDVACGRGRNALFMAARGNRVTGIDISDDALRLIKEEAEQSGLNLNLSRADLKTGPCLPEAAFDLILDFFYLERSLFPALMRSLKPGGVMVVRTFSRAGNFPGGPSHQGFVLDAGELMGIFDGWEILCHEDGIESSHKGGGLSGIVARRPPDWA